MNFPTAWDWVAYFLERGAYYLGQHSGEFVAGFGGAGIGAYAAYLFERSRERRAEMDRRFSALVETQLVLAFYLSSLINIKSQVLDPFETIPNRALQMGLQLNNPNRSVLDLKSLSFLAETKFADCLMSLNLCANRYFNLLDGFDDRNNQVRHLQATISVDQFNPRTGQGAGIVNGIQVKLLTDHTEFLFSSTPRTIDIIDSTMTKIDSAARTLFPKRKVPKFIRKDTP
jgi:hypothetical protein